MRSNRAFLRRAVRALVAAGVHQYLDIGSGIPTAGNVHEVAQEAAPESKVIYVDNDPVPRWPTARRCWPATGGRRCSAPICGSRIGS